MKSRTLRKASLWALFLLGIGACRSAPVPYPGFESVPKLQKPDAPQADPAPGPSRPIDLGTALRLAAGSHLDVLEARARVREAEGRASAADGYLLPVLSAGALIAHTQGTVQNSTGDLQQANFNSLNGLGTVRISTNVGESIYRDLAAHRLADAASDFEVATLQQTLLSVALAYLDLVEADIAVRIQQQFVTESQGLVRLTQARELQGLGTALDSERARAQLAALEQRVIVTQNERQRRSKALSAALRLDSTLDLDPVDKDLSPASLLNPADPLQSWMQRASSRRPEARALEWQKVAAEHEASATRWSAWGPELSGLAYFGDVGKSFGTLDERDGWAVLVGWNLSFGGPGRIEAAEARREQANIALDRFRDRLQASVAGAYQEVQLARNRLDPAQRELDSAEKALKIANATFQGGLLSETDLLLAQQGADQARLRRLTAIVRYNEAQLRLLAESGVGSVDAFTGGAAPK
jgi:outer membrane protein TolC